MATRANKYQMDRKSGGKRILIIVGVLLIFAAVAVAVAVPLALTINDADTTLQKANALLDEVPIIDGHNDWAWQFRALKKNQINDINLDDDLTAAFPTLHTDIPRLKTGKVGAQFWACYCSCRAMHKDAVRQGLEQVDMIRRFTEAYPDDFQFVTTAAEIEAANKAGKIGSLIGVEGGHMIDSSLAALRMYFALGARYMTLTHSCDTPWADASNQNYSNGGLTEFGKNVVREMNRLGMLVDLSHVSDQVMNDVLDIVSAPVIFSHSSARALCDHVRNVPDSVLDRIPSNGGIVMVNFYNDYVTCNDSATLSDVADHFDYLKQRIGAQYIGIGADYDGVTRVPVGLEDVSKYPHLIAELMKRKWTDTELKQIAGLNLLRVMRKVEDVARNQASVKPDETWISESSVDFPCRA